jgi:hypothetical protein
MMMSNSRSEDDEATTALSQRSPKKQRQIRIMNDNDDDNSNNDNNEEGVVGAAGQGGEDAAPVGAAAREPQGPTPRGDRGPVPAPAPVPALRARVPEPPPEYDDDGTAAAKDVFARTHFYHTKRDAENPDGARRATAMGEEASVRGPFEDFHSTAAAAKKSRVRVPSRPPEALAEAVGARDGGIQAPHCNTADVGTRTHSAGIFLKAKYKGDFQERTVEVGAALDPLLAPLTTTPAAAAAAAEASTATATGTTADNEPQGRGGESPPATTRAAAAGRTLNVGFLKDLRLAEDEERFLIPTTLYVRDCMKVIFGMFLEDVKDDAVPPASNSTALVGSSGVGASILFFLAALHQARTRRVVYFRITKVRQEQVSLFVMTPAPDDATSVRVWFSRNMDVRAVKYHGGINRVSLDLESELDIRRQDYYAYIDGPHHSDETNLMVGTYDYFCTSGGFPLYRNGERGKRLWILDGWTREEAIAGLMAVAGCDETKADEIYRLCGGTIRDMLVACGDPQKIRDEIDRRISNLGEDAATMAMTLLSAQGSNAPSSPDRLRTMFLDKSMLLPEGDERGAASVSWDDVLDAFKPERASERHEPRSGGGYQRDVMDACQVVDSDYALNQLAEKLNVDSFVKSYECCLKLGMASRAQSFLECIQSRSRGGSEEDEETSGQGGLLVEQGCGRVCEGAQ